MERGSGWMEGMGNGRMRLPRGNKGDPYMKSYMDCSIGASNSALEHRRRREAAGYLLGSNCAG
jgi:hypothetical protein